MSIGIDFILRANSAGFTRGLAQANNSLKDVKKGLGDFNVGFGAKSLIGIGGIIQGFRAAMNHASDLRDEADRLGKSIDQGTRSVAEFSDAVGRIGTGFKDALSDGLSFFTKMGDGMRHFFQNVTQEQEDAARNMVAVTAKAADEQDARLKKSREDNSPEKQAEAQAKLDRAVLDGQVKGTDQEKKLIGLVNDRYDLEQKLKKVGPETVEAKNIKLQLQENENASRAIEQDQEEARKKKADDKEKKAAEATKALVSKFAPSVEELAAQEVGGFTEANDPRLAARQVLKKEKLAETLFGRGDFKGGLEAARVAQSTRKALEDRTGEGGALTAKNAEDAFKAGLETTNGKLDALTKAVSGIIKAQN